MEEQKLGKEVTAAVATWVVQVELNFGHFLSSYSSKGMVGIEDIGQEEMETIG